MQTITPSLGVARTMGVYTRNMEDLHLSLNEWIREAGTFDMRPCFTTIATSTSIGTHMGHLQLSGARGVG